MQSIPVVDRMSPTCAEKQEVAVGKRVPHGLKDVRDLLLSLAAENRELAGAVAGVEQTLGALVKQRDSVHGTAQTVSDVSTRSAQLSGELKEKNHSLARANALSAELVAEIDEKNAALEQANHELARANANAAELMAEVELKNGRIAELNGALAHANAHAAECLAQLEEHEEEQKRLNFSLSEANSKLRETNEDLMMAQIKLKQQTQELLVAERHRVMLESLGAACHHLGQPITVLTTAMEIIARWDVSPDKQELVEICRGAALEAGDLLRKMQYKSAYEAEPYLVDIEGKADGELILAL